MRIRSETFRRGGVLAVWVGAATVLSLVSADAVHARGSIPVLIQVTNNTEGDVFDPRIRSQDGNRLVFTSTGDVTGPAPGHSEVYLYDVESRATTRVTNTPDGFESREAARPIDQVFASGRPEYVAFISTGDLDPNGDNSDGNPEVFLWEIGSGAFHQLTNTPSTVTNRDPYASDAGKCIVFSSDGNIDNNDGSNPGNVGPDHSNEDGSFEVFMYELDTDTNFPHDGLFTQLSNGPAGTNSSRPVVGGYIWPRQCDETAYMSDFDQTDRGFTGTNIFIYDRSSTLTTPMETREVPWGIQPGNYLYPNISSASPFARGPFVVFQTTADVWRNGSIGFEVFRYRVFHPRMTQYTDIMVGSVERPVVSDGGGNIVFQSTGEILDPRRHAKKGGEPPFNADGNYEIFSLKGRRKILQLTRSTGCNNTLPSARDDQTAITFRSDCELIPGGNPNNVPQVFLYREVKRNHALSTEAGCVVANGCCNEVNGCYQPIFGQKPKPRRKECVDRPQRSGCKDPPS